jgi:hypothetical protein
MDEPNFYQLFTKVGNIEGRLDTIEKNISKIIDNHENRLNCVEKTTDQMVGKVSIFGAITGFVGGIVTVVISKFIR